MLEGLKNNPGESLEASDNDAQSAGWESVKALATKESTAEIEPMNTEPCFGEVYKTYVINTLRLYESIEQSDIPEEEKEATFNTELSNYIAKDTEKMGALLSVQTKDQRLLDMASTELHRGSESLNFASVKNLYDTFINDVELVADDYEGNMYVTIPNEQKIFDEQLLNDDGEVQINPEIKYDFSRLKDIYDFAKEHDKQIKFHVFLWHGAIPNNLKSEVDNVADPSLRRKMVLGFLDDYASKLAGFMKENDYDLRQLEALNEIAHDDDPRKATLRDSWWKDAIGENPENGDSYYVDVLKIVRKNFPNTELIYNEYNEFIDWKADRIVDILEEIKHAENRDGTKLLDGIGLQAHYSDFIKGPNIFLTEEDIKKTAGKIQRACGDKKIYITEYDFVDILKNGSKERLEKAFIETYSKIANGFMMWGNSDALTWYRCTDDEGNSMNAQIIDSNGKPKEIYKTIKDAFYLSKKNEPAQ